MNFMLIMKNEKSDLVAIGPVSIEYQAAVLRDELEESSDWTSVGIARVLTEAQARDLASRRAPVARHRKSRGAGQCPAARTCAGAIAAWWRECRPATVMP